MLTGQERFCEILKVLFVVHSESKFSFISRDFPSLRTLFLQLLTKSLSLTLFCKTIWHFFEKAKIALSIHSLSERSIMLFKFLGYGNM